MNKQTLVSLIEKVKNGIEVEKSSIDIKREWWQIETTEGLDEFLKDICSMANSQSGDSYIILGIDETGEIFDASLPLDEADLQAKHKDKIEPRIKLSVSEFQIESKTLTVITIPHSNQRPHVIKKFQDRHNWIPVRFGSSTLTASRSDLDEMYNERDKQYQADLRIRLYEEKIRWGQYSTYGDCCFLIRLSLDNYAGGAPDYIVKAELRHRDTNLWRSQHFVFDGLELDQEFKVNAHERKKAVQLYVSDKAPQNTESNCTFPPIQNTLFLNLYTRSGNQITIDIQPEWVVSK